ncbi:MAG: hypothetical protein Ta2B_00470 [Termitinemataceae bacterium]|nr:MAG: hypothetical protein Ta2B_00470 [Termitinemataceae bacterium]
MIHSNLENTTGARGNPHIFFMIYYPIKLKDPDGRTATYSIDEENKTININVDITVHGNVDNLQQIANEYKAGIDAAWGKDSNGNAWQMNINGSDYSVNFNVTVTADTNLDSETAIKNNRTGGTKNIILASPTIASSNVTEGFFGIWVTVPRLGVSVAESAAHEFGHLLGFRDRYDPSSGKTHDGYTNTIMSTSAKRSVDQRHISALGNYISESGGNTGVIRVDQKF